ncbi:MAG: hypothetical protein HC865_02300 [Cyanobacteria bacterium RU_5_0]|nr:hypothetical protein [Cyanobacteria bacterium RU_5_0]
MISPLNTSRTLLDANIPIGDRLVTAMKSSRLSFFVLRGAEVKPLRGQRPHPPLPIKLLLDKALG